LSLSNKIIKIALYLNRKIFGCLGNITPDPAKQIFKIKDKNFFDKTKIKTTPLCMLITIGVTLGKFIMR
jgi:hypothetical protein